MKNIAFITQQITPDNPLHLHLKCCAVSASTTSRPRLGNHISRMALIQDCLKKKFQMKSEPWSGKGP